MRAMMLLFGAATLLALAACRGPAATNTAATAIPGGGETARTPGLWVERVADHDSVSETRYCLDSATAGQLSYFGRQLSGKCSANEIAQAADGAWRFKTRCGDAATDGFAHGDFAKHYSIEAKTTIAGRPHRVQADISWQGACPKDMKPGDIVLPGGERTRISDLPGPA